MLDQYINCVDCGTEFTWTTGEQKFYADREMSAPKRCSCCRIKKRQERDRRESKIDE